MFLVYSEILVLKSLHHMHGVIRHYVEIQTQKPSTPRKQIQYRILIIEHIPWMIQVGSLRGKKSTASSFWFWHFKPNIVSKAFAANQCAVEQILHLMP